MGYEQELLEWQAGRDAYLRMENSWLALAGLTWLVEGDNKVGSAETNQIRLPEGAPDFLGIFVLENRKVRWIGSAENPATSLDGKELLDRELRQDMIGSPDLVKWNNLSMMVIQRGDQFAIRLWDNGRAQRETYPGRQWFAPDKSWIVEAKFERLAAPEQREVDTTIGTQSVVVASGYITFEREGETHKLVVSETVSGLSISFGDMTNGDATYPIGRYLQADLPDGDRAVIDFNRAYSPPCSVTNWATCPMPPRENKLPIKVEAGERYFHYDSQ